MAPAEEDKKSEAGSVHSGDEKSEKPEKTEKPEKPEKPEKKLDVIPDAVDFFLGQLKDAIGTKNVSLLHKLYEEDYNKLKENYKGKRWPSAETVAEKVSNEALFLILYKELYYRHVYCEMQPTFEDRRGSWNNYCKLLGLLCSDLEDGDELSVHLPTVWIWDILDEFVYHFQTFCTTRTKVAVKTENSSSAIGHYKDNPEVFETKKVLQYLHQLVHFSKVQGYLANKTGGTGGAFTDEMARYIGYFAMLQLLRMHCLLGDYHSAMRTIQHIDIDEEVPLFYKISACHVTLYYYMGFCYLMMRRYADAIRTFSDVLVFLSKISGVNKKSYQFEAINKKQSQMLALLVIALALCPRPIDESIEKMIRNDTNLSEQQAFLQRGDQNNTFANLFNIACPKFVAAAPPNYDNLAEVKHNEVLNRQKELFQQEVRQQQFLPRIDSYMKLYTAIKITKLAQLCDLAPDALRDQLMCVMHKTSQLVRTKGTPLDGEAQHCSEVEFYIDGDMVHINAQKTEQEHADVFLEQILKFQELLKKIGSKDDAKTGAAPVAGAEEVK